MIGEAAGIQVEAKERTDTLKPWHRILTDSLFQTIYGHHRPFCYNNLNPLDSFSQIL